MKSRLFLVLISCSLVAFAMGQSFVYDNTTTSLNNNHPLLPEWLNDSAEVGDEIWLDGSDREAVELGLIFTNRGTSPNYFDAQVRFRILDANESPADVFFDTGIIPGMYSPPGLTVYFFAIPHVIVPDRFVWTIQLYNRTGPGNELGPSYYNPPTVGHSEDFFWRYETGGDWTPYSWGGQPVANFGASLTAVPEPSLLAALSIGVLGIIRRRARAH